MSKIVNEYVKGDEIVEAVRSAIEFRATWMGLIFDEMRKAGVDAEGITRRAITRCGHLDGKKIKAAADGKEVDGNEEKIPASGRSGSGPGPGGEHGFARRRRGCRPGGDRGPGGHDLRRHLRPGSEHPVRPVAGRGDHRRRRQRRLLQDGKPGPDRGHPLRRGLRQQDLHHRGGDAAGGKRQGEPGRPGDPVSERLQDGGSPL